MLHQILANAQTIISCLVLLASAAVVRIGHRNGHLRSRTTLLPAAYLALHGAMGLVFAFARGLAIPRDQVHATVAVLDVAGLLLLALTLLDVDHATSAVRDRLLRSREHALEYARARRDYEQLMRHRIANPLTVVEGGVQTLVALGDRLDTPTRGALLAAIADAAARLREVSIDPAQRSAEEHELHASPRGIGAQDATGPTPPAGSWAAPSTQVRALAASH